MPDTGTISTYESGEDLVVEWKIDFFTLPEEDGWCYGSPDFSFGGEEWCVGIVPNGWSGRDSLGHVDLGLCKCESNSSVTQSFSLALKTAEGEKYNEQHFTRDFKDDNDIHEYMRFISRSELTERRSELLPDDVLTVICTMKSSASA